MYVLRGQLRGNGVLWVSRYSGHNGFKYRRTNGGNVVMSKKHIFNWIVTILTVLAITWFVVEYLTGNY